MVLLDMEIMFLFLVVPVDRKFLLGRKSRTDRTEFNGCVFRSTEKWTMDGEDFSGEYLGPNFDHYPEIFKVTADFCSSNK